MELFVIETIMPDGPHWYGGVRRMQKDNTIVQGPEWSPYWEDRKELNKEQADFTFEAVCKKMSGCKIVPVGEALSKDAWILYGDKGAYMIRAKYMAVGQIIDVPGRSGFYKVMERTEKEIRLCRSTESGDLRGAGGDQLYIGVNSNKFVTVIGVVRRDTA